MIYFTMSQMFQDAIKKPNKLTYLILNSVLSLKKPVIVARSDSIC